MNKIKSDRELWREQWLKSINELTSLALQKSKWIDVHDSNPHWSFTEFICCYFDDVLDGNDYQKFIRFDWISKDEYEIIKDWHEMLDQYYSPSQNDFDSLSILNDLKWIEITKAGNIAKVNLSILLSQDEKFLLELLNQP